MNTYHTALEYNDSDVGDDKEIAGEAEGTRPVRSHYCDIGSATASVRYAVPASDAVHFARSGAITAIPSVLTQLLHQLTSHLVYWFFFSLSSYT